MFVAFLSSLLFAVGVLLGGILIKRINLSSFSCIGLAIISFILAFILHAKVQDAMLDFFVNFPFVGHSTIIGFIAKLCGISFLLICLVEVRKKPAPSSTDKIEIVPDYENEIYSYLDVLYNDVGLFIKQYYDSDNSHNNQLSGSLHRRMGKFVPLLSRHKLSIPDKLTEEITALFDMLFNYKGKVEGAVSYKRDETAYKRWLKINEEFNKKVSPALKKLKRELQAQVNDETYEKIAKNNPSKPLSARELNAYIADKPHKCSYCGYSFSIMPENLEDGKNYMVKNPPCPSCGNVDEISRVY